MRLILSFLIVLAFAILARAEGRKGQGQDPMRQACGADAERFCKGSSSPGMCLHEHWDELSQGCRDFKENMKKKWEAKQQQKKGDDSFRRHCGGDLELTEGCRAFKEGINSKWESQQSEGRAEKTDKAEPKKEKSSFRWSDPAKEAGGNQTGEKQRPGAD